MIGIFYILLLLAGLIGFLAHLLAQVRMAHIMRKRYPEQWDIVAAPQSRGRRLRTWARLQRVLRNGIPELFEDPRLTRWYRCWRYAPWVAWPCWIGALALRALANP